jgi:hypothetical protein
MGDLVQLAGAAYTGYKVASKVHSSYKSGKKLFDYLSSIDPKNVTMTVKLERSDGYYKLTFTAVKDSLWHSFTQMNVIGKVPSYATSKSKNPDVFQIIEVQTNVKAAGDKFFDKFVEEKKVSQKRVINYLKTYCDFFKDDYLCESQDECIAKHDYYYCPTDTDIVDEGTMYTWKITYSIRKR